MSLPIGEVAAAAAVNIQTIRYYERRGLLEVPPRTAAGYRQYPMETPERLRFIKGAQELGFSLEEVRELLSLRVPHSRASETTCATVEASARRKIGQVRAKIRELQRLERTLKHLVASCASEMPANRCPILDEIGKPDLQPGRAAPSARALLHA